MKSKITFLMLHGLILKVTKFNLPLPKPLRTVIKNILVGAIIPMSNRVKKIACLSSSLKQKVLDKFHPDGPGAICRSDQDLIMVIYKIWKVNKETLGLHSR